MKKIMLFIALITLTKSIVFAKKTSPDPIASAIKKEINKKNLPSCVVCITKKGKTVYHKAFGNQMVTPALVKTEKNTLYDLASLTKLYTATLIMRLQEAGKLSITVPVATYLEEFQAQDKKNITLEQLLTHRSGLPAGNPVEDYTQGIEQAVKKIAALPLQAPPGKKFIYSDLGAILAGYIAEKVTGQTLAALFKKYIFAPLKLQQTLVFPSPRFLNHIAPTNIENNVLIHGRVHDPRAYALGGIAGNAGIFATAADVAKFGNLFLNTPLHEERPFLSKKSIAIMTTPAPQLQPGEQRGIGFDIDTPLSFAKGEKFSAQSFGHVGFTGTSLWIDPPSQTVVVFLSNRLHPDGRGDVKELRRLVGTLAATLTPKTSSSRGK